MLDLTGLPALDLAIGLAFIFFLLSTLAATIQELIASVLGLRARTLEQGLRSLLEDPEKGWHYVDRFYDHPLITSLSRTPPPAVLTGAAQRESRSPSDELGRNAHTQSRSAAARAVAFFKRTGGPSYISPRTFAHVVLDNFAPAEGESTVFDKGIAALDGLPAGIRARLRPLRGAAAAAQNDVESLRTQLEGWYDDTMARVSGWYKRKTQIILIVIGILLVPAINANTIVMGERMWKDDTVRSAVVSQAQAAASATTAPGGSAPSASRKLDQAADDVDKVAKVGIPMGWRGAAVPHDVLSAIAGWTITILAISLGAPFWFDALGRLSRLRSSGKPETPLPPPGSGKPNERILTPPQQRGA
jgi:hypothetical protein